jgi:hypothetical protein
MQSLRCRRGLTQSRRGQRGSLTEHRIAAFPSIKDKAAWARCTRCRSMHLIADPKAVGVQRASARRHQLSVATTPIAATRSGSSSWMIDTWLAAAAPPMPIHSAGAA